MHNDAVLIPVDEPRVQLLEGLLRQFDELHLECDGMSRVVSMCLSYLDIEHVIYIGGVVVEGEGAIPHHYWVGLRDGSICDLRARMWLGSAPAVPHGLFMRQPGHKYTASAMMEAIPYSEVVFWVLAGNNIEHFLQSAKASA